MKTTFKEYDCVELVKDFQNQKKGDWGTILLVHNIRNEEPNYLVEFHNPTMEYGEDGYEIVEISDIPQSALVIKKNAADAI